MLQKKWLIISCGDADGVGYELVLKILSSSRNPFIGSFNPVIIGSFNWLKYIAYKYNITFFPFKINTEILQSFQLLDLSKNHCLVIDILPEIKNSEVKKFIGKISFFSLEKMCEVVNFFLRNNLEFFVLTMPISKSKICKFYKNFKGHTEYFADKFNISKNKISMLMKGKDKEGNIYRVLLLTRHVPLVDVSKNLNSKDIFFQVNNVVNFINKYEEKKVKKIFFCNLNPHSGEEGKIGKEEKTIILDGIRLLKKHLSIEIIFPLQASDAFNYAKKNTNSLIVATYHDQAMVPLKLLCGYNIVNITVGLPFIRVSPGHGTASDVALKNKVDVSGVILCLETLFEFSKKL